MNWENEDEATHIFGGNDPALDAPWQVNVTEVDTRTMTAVEIGFEYGRGVLDAKDTFVWREGMRDWIALGVCPELVPVLAQFQAQRQRAISLPLPPRAPTALPATVPGPMFAPTPSFAPQPHRPTQPSMPLGSPPALSTGLSPLRGPMATHSTGQMQAFPGSQFNPSAGERADGASGFAGVLPLPGLAPPTVEDKSKFGKLGLLVGAIVVLLVVVVGVGWLLTKDSSKPTASSVASASVSSASSAFARGPELQADPVGLADSVGAGTALATVPAGGAVPTAATASPLEVPKGLPAVVGSPDKGAVRSDAGIKGTAPEKTPEPQKDPPRGADAPPFNIDAAKAALSSAAGGASGCGKPNGPTGRGRATVMFSSSGSVASVSVDPPFAGTPVGSCAVGAFRSARVPAFSGGSQSVTKSFNVK